ncbi:MAG TPA: ABC transporter ATP-binding protein [Polyangiaceae bacterium]|jgi:branched-chain amino acid transport system ATP-binding protein|nr:ABC transporter ATP-binding protein [Polyangiaceae bacterium]
MLQVRALSRRFGGVYAVQDVSLRVEPGELRGVIGPNGAGKSTLFHLIAGHLKPTSGSVCLAGAPIDRYRPDQRARLGIAIVYQGDRIFRRMTVRENVMVGAHSQGRHGFLEAALRLPRCRREERELRAQADAVLERVGLGAVAEQLAESLSLGQQRTVQLARALAANPKVLLLDEPAAGLRASERTQLARLIREVRANALTVLLVEHDVALVTSLSDTITVLDLGRVIAEGEPSVIRRDPAVLAAYLGAPAPP